MDLANKMNIKGRVTSTHGGRFYFIFDQKWSKFGTPAHFSDILKAATPRTKLTFKTDALNSYLF
jgi:hypothetical protein